MNHKRCIVFSVNKQWHNKTGSFFSFSYINITETLFAVSVCLESNELFGEKKNAAFHSMRSRGNTMRIVCLALTSFYNSGVDSSSRGG